eukprot:1467720-Ditylum_brightwellii.AAC.1
MYREPPSYRTNRAFQTTEFCGSSAPGIAGKPAEHARQQSRTSPNQGKDCTSSISALVRPFGTCLLFESTLVSTSGSIS